MGLLVLPDRKVPVSGPRIGIPEQINQIALALSHAMVHSKAFVIEARIAGTSQPCYCVAIAGRHPDGGKYIMPLALLMDETAAALVEGPSAPPAGGPGGN